MIATHDAEAVSASRRAALSESRPVAAARRLTRQTLIALTAIGAATFAPAGAHLWALRAAGAFKGQAIAGIEHFVGALQGNLVWLGGTAMGLIIAVVAILFMAGHSRAHDVMLKTLIGLAILASISGIVA